MSATAIHNRQMELLQKVAKLCEFNEYKVVPTEVITPDLTTIGGDSFFIVNDVAEKDEFIMYDLNILLRRKHIRIGEVPGKFSDNEVHLGGAIGLTELGLSNVRACYELSAIMRPALASMRQAKATK